MNCCSLLESCSNISAWGRSFFRDRKSTRLNSSHTVISYAVFCLKKKNASANSPRSSMKKMGGLKSGASDNTIGGSDRRPEPREGAAPTRGRRRPRRELDELHRQR